MGVRSARRATTQSPMNQSHAAGPPPCHSIFWESEDVVDVWALARNAASALPYIAFRGRYEYPMPEAAIAALRRISEVNEIAAGRPPLVPGDGDGEA